MTNILRNLTPEMVNQAIKVGLVHCLSSTTKIVVIPELHLAIIECTVHGLEDVRRIPSSLTPQAYLRFFLESF